MRRPIRIINKRLNGKLKQVIRMHGIEYMLEHGDNKKIQDIITNNIVINHAKPKTKRKKHVKQKDGKKVEEEIDPNSFEAQARGYVRAKQREQLGKLSRLDQMQLISSLPTVIPVPATSLATVGPRRLTPAPPASVTAPPPSVTASPAPVTASPVASPPAAPATPLAAVSRPPVKNGKKIRRTTDAVQLDKELAQWKKDYNKLINRQELADAELLDVLFDGNPPKRITIKQIVDRMLDIGIKKEEIVQNDPAGLREMILSITAYNMLDDLDDPEKYEMMDFYNELDKRIERNRQDDTMQPVNTGKMEEDDDVSIDPEDNEYETYQDGMGKSRTGGLNTIDLMELSKRFLPDKKVQVIPRDHISKIEISPLGEAYVIMNTDPANKPGEHWIAIYISIKRYRSVEIYDSLAEPLPEGLIDDLKKRLKKHRLPEYLLKLKVNEVKDQDSNAATCGLFSLAFLIDRSNNIDFKEASNYSKNLNGNDNIVKDRFGYI